MSTSYRDQPKWVTKAIVEAESRMLSRLEASAALMRLIMEAAAANTEAMLHPPADDARQAAAAPISKAEQETIKVTANLVTQGMRMNKPRKRYYFPRIYAPQMMVLGHRAAELLVALAPIIRDRSMALLRAGIDPRPLVRRASSMHVAHVLLDELGIDLANLDKLDHEHMLKALQVVQGWIDECKREPITYLRPKEAGPRSGPLAEFLADHDDAMRYMMEGDIGTAECMKNLMKMLARRSTTALPKMPTGPNPTVPDPMAVSMPKADPAAEAQTPPAEAQGESGRAPAPYSAGSGDLSWTRGE